MVSFIAWRHSGVDMLLACFIHKSAVICGESKAGDPYNFKRADIEDPISMRSILGSGCRGLGGGCRSIAEGQCGAFHMKVFVQEEAIGPKL